MIPKIKTYSNKFGNPKFSYLTIIVLTGAVFEKKGQKGLSHFIEHLIFKGSKYNDNIKILNNKLNSMGMSINAFTTHFITSFHINTPTFYLEEAIDALVQMVFNPLFRENDIENERKVVINELLQKASSPEHLAELHAQKTLYTKDNPLNHPVIGNIKDLSSITRDDILEYYKTYYQPKNIFFFASSQKDDKYIENLWKKSYEKYGNKEQEYIQSKSTIQIFNELKPRLSLSGEPGIFKFTKYFPKNTSIYVLIDIMLPKLTKKELFSLNIFSNYLAGSLSSKLFLEMREKRQLIYSVHAEVSPSIDLVNFTIEFNCEKNNKILNKCFKTINIVLNDFYKNGMPIKEFNKFKNKTLIDYQKIKSSGVYKINRFLDKYYYNISEYNYEAVIKSINNSFLFKIIKNKFNDKKTKQFIFIS